MHIHWTFKLKINSHSVVYTKEMIDEIKNLLKASEKIFKFEIEELFEEGENQHGSC